MTTKTMTQIAAEVAEQCEDAWSYDRYSSWKGAAMACLKRGFTAEQTEEILRSKLTRWAADQAADRGHGYGRATGADLGRFLDSQENLARDLVEGRL